MHQKCAKVFLTKVKMTSLLVVQPLKFYQSVFSKTYQNVEVNQVKKISFRC